LVASSTFLGTATANNQFANNTLYPTTLNLFAVPQAYFPWTLALLAEKFSWTELNVVYNPNEKNVFYFSQRKMLAEILPNFNLNFVSLVQLNATFAGFENVEDLWTCVRIKRGVLINQFPTILGLRDTRIKHL
jgi:hypothetical protein